MFNLVTTSDKIQVITGSAGDIEYTWSGMDKTTGSDPVPVGDPTPASITTAATTDIVPVPAASTVRNVKGLSFFNNHASNSNLIQVQTTDGSNTSRLAVANLLAQELLSFNQVGDWTHYDADGIVKATSVVAATQTEMEAAASTSAFVTPARQHFHPGHPKFWAQVTGAGTPVLSSSYNVTSITDTGVGRLTVTIATDFSSTTWCCQAISFTSTTTGDEGICNINAKAAGTVEIGNRIITPAFADPNVGYDVVGFGDQ